MEKQHHWILIVESRQNRTTTKGAVMDQLKGIRKQNSGCLIGMTALVQPI